MKIMTIFKLARILKGKEKFIISFIFSQSMFICSLIMLLLIKEPLYKGISFVLTFIAAYSNILLAQYLQYCLDLLFISQGGNYENYSSNYSQEQEDYNFEEVNENDNNGENE